MARAQELADWEGFNKRARIEKRRQAARHWHCDLCRGLRQYGPETATCTLDNDGGVTLLIGSQSTGQGHATSYAQLIAEHLGLTPDGAGVFRAIPTGSNRRPAPADRAQFRSAASRSPAPREARRATQGDCDRCAGSRSGDLEFAMAPCASPARIALFHLPISPRIRPRPKSSGPKTFGAEPPTFPNGTHIAEVDIDPATGDVDIMNYVIVDDFGATLNPLCSPARCMAARCRVSDRL